jgi:glycosyltransferase involved in cell wall biosynthesis
LNRSRPFISVITVSLDAEATIEDTVASVSMQQANFDFEHVCVDGGSTDGTRRIIDRWTERNRFITRIYERDCGIFDAMNKGIGRCRGGIVGIINSDDWYVPDAVAGMVAAFREDPLAGVIYGNIDLLSERDGHHEVIYSNGEPGHLVSGFAIYHPACFVRAAVYRQHGLYDQRYHNGADYDLLLRFFERGVRFRYVDAVIAGMREGGKSDREALRTIRDFREIQVRHGTGAALAFTRYASSLALVLIRQLVNRLGLRRLIYLRRGLQRQRIRRSKGHRG